MKQALEFWDDFQFEATGLDTSAGTPQTVNVRAPLSKPDDELILSEFSIVASAAGVALTRLDVLTLEGHTIYSFQQLGAQTLRNQSTFKGIKVPPNHRLRFAYTNTVASTAGLIANYKSRKEKE